jgi:hypothetical protein
MRLVRSADPMPGPALAGLTAIVIDMSPAPKTRAKLRKKHLHSTVRDLPMSKTTSQGAVWFFTDVPEMSP